MENGGIRIVVFLLLGVAGLTALSSLVGSGDPSEAIASEDASTDAEEPEILSPSAARSRFAAAARSADLPPAPTAASRASAALAEYLRGDHSLTLPNPRPELHAWTWEDDSVQLVYERCKPVARDPAVSKTSLSVRALIDFDALAAIEQHFGFDPKDIFTLESVSEDTAEYSLATHLGDDAVTVLSQHGIIVGDSTIRADFAWLVEQTAPQLRSLSDAVVAEWRRAMPPPARGKAPKPGNIERSDTTLEALTSFVQRAVPYESIPSRTQDIERCGVRTPGPTLKRGADCDSKALLLAAMIRSLDSRVPIVLVSLSVAGRPHMLIGVGVPARECDAILDYRGTRYVLVEVTSALGVGVMAPDYNEAVLEHYAVIP